MILNSKEYGNVDIYTRKNTSLTTMPFYREQVALCVVEIKSKIQMNGPLILWSCFTDWILMVVILTKTMLATWISVYVLRLGHTQSSQKCNNLIKSSLIYGNFVSLRQSSQSVCIAGKKVDIATCCLYDMQLYLRRCKSLRTGDSFNHALYFSRITSNIWGNLNAPLNALGTPDPS